MMEHSNGKLVDIDIKQRLCVTENLVAYPIKNQGSNNKF